MSKALPHWLNKMLGQSRLPDGEPHDAQYSRTRSRRRAVLGQAMTLELLEVRRMLSSIVGRNLFYNNSAWDGNTPAASAKDDSAIATDKTALLGNQTASFANYSSYSRGINGVMVDIQDLPTSAKLTKDDFEFYLGNSADDTFWTSAPDPVSISVRRGAGKKGSDRVTIIWKDAAILKQWLQVVVRPTDQTGLSEPDIFYFGSAPGETGNDASTRVNSTDEILIRWNPKTLLNPAAITDHYDINRDKKVDGTDQVLARNNTTNLKTDLLKLKPTLSTGGVARVQMLSATAARLSWFDTSLEDRGVAIQASENGGAYEQLAIAPRNASAAIVTGLTPGADYSFKIVTQGAGDAQVTQLVSGQTPQSTGNTCPTYYHITNLEPIHKGEASYTGTESPKLTAKDEWVSGTTWQQAMYKAVTGVVNIQPINVNYDVQESPNNLHPELSHYGAFEIGTAAELEANHASFDLRKPAYGSIPGTQGLIVLEDTYHSTNIDLDYDDFYWKVEMAATQTPAAPFHIIATPITGTDIQVTWRAGTATVDRQIVERSIDGGQTWEEAGRLAPGESTFLDRRLSYERPYTYRVYAEDDNGNEYRTDETATATTFKDQPELIYYKITGFSGFTPTAGHSVSGTLTPDSDWILANSPAEAAWLALHSRVGADDTAGIVAGGNTYRFNTPSVIGGDEISDGAFRFEQDPVTGVVKIHIEDTFGSSTATVCSYNWLDAVGTVSYLASPIGATGDVHGVGGEEYSLTLDQNNAPVTNWTVQWDSTDPSSVRQYTPDASGQPKVVTWTYPVPTGEGEKVYTIQVKATIAGQIVPTVDKRVFIGKEAAVGAEEGEELAALTTKQARRFILQYFSDIYSTIKYEPYPGQKKGPGATAQTGRGNDWDQASLLASRITAKVADTKVEYVHQVVNAPMVNVRNWLGVKDNASAWEVLHKAGILADDSSGSWKALDPDSYPTTLPNFARMKSVNLWHTWLRVGVPGTANPQGVHQAWWDLDPSWKYRRFNKGLSQIGTDGGMTFDPIFYNNIDAAGTEADKRQLPLDWYEGQVMGYISKHNSLAGRVGIGDVAYDGPIIAKYFAHERIRSRDGNKSYEAPRQTEYSIITTSPKYVGNDPSSMTALGDANKNFTHRVVLQMKVDSDYSDFKTFSVPVDGAKAIGIGADMRINNVFAQLPMDNIQKFEYHPRLIIGDRAFDLDGAFKTKWYGANSGVKIRMWTVRPGESDQITGDRVEDPNHLDPRRTEYFRRVYQRHGILINAQQHSVDSVMAIQENLNGWALSRQEADKYQTELMSMTANTYAFEYEQQRQGVTGITQTMAVQPGVEVGLASTMAEYQIRYNDGSNKTAAALQNPVILDRKDPTDSNFKSVLDIDLGRRRDNLVPIQQETSTTRLERARKLLGYTSSALEHSVIQNVLNARSVSTALVFQRAKKTNVSLVIDALPEANPQPSIDSSSMSAATLATFTDTLKDLLKDANGLNNRFKVTYTYGAVEFGDPGKGWKGVAFEAEKYNTEGNDEHIFGIIDNAGRLYRGGAGDETQSEVAEKGEDQTAMAPFGSGVVNLYSGDLSYSESDFSIPNPTLPLEFKRYYDSSRLNVNRGLGAGWGHTYSDYLELYRFEDKKHGKEWPKDYAPLAADRVIVVSGAGTNAEFRHKDISPGGIHYYEDPTGVYGMFSFNPNTHIYTYVEKDGTARIFEMTPNGGRPRYRLKEIHDRFNNKLVLSYYTTNSTDGLVGDLAEVRYYDAGTITNRRMHFLYHTSTFKHHIKAITDFADRSWLYEYGDLRVKFKIKGKEYDGKKLWVLTKVTAPTGLNSAAPAGAVDAAKSVSQQMTSRYTYNYGNMLGGKLASAERWVDEGKRNDYQFKYYPNGRVFKITDPDKNPEYYSYNLFAGKYGNERRTYTSQAVQYNRAHQRTQTDYDDNGLSTRIIEPDRSRVFQGWDKYQEPPPQNQDPARAKYRIIWRQGEAGLYEAFYYDARGDVTRHITGAHNFEHNYGNWAPGPQGAKPADISGFVTDMTYWNDVDKYTNASNSNVIYANMILAQDTVVMAELTGEHSEQLERRTTNHYDAFGRLEWTKDAEGHVTAFGYNPNGQIWYKGLPGGTTLSGNTANIDQHFKVVYEYDPKQSGQVLKVHRYLNKNLNDTVVSENEYDSIGLGRALISKDGTTDSNSNKRYIQRVYDVFGRVTDEFNHADVVNNLANGPALNQPIGTHYDFDGDWLMATTSPGNVDHPTKTTRYTYDLRGNRITSSDTLNTAAAPTVFFTAGITTTLYDAIGNLTATVNAAADRTNYYYDTRNRRYETLSPDNGFEQMLYDATGRVTEKFTPSDQVMNYRLDPAARTQLFYGIDGGLRITIDPVGNTSRQDLNRFGEVITSSDEDFRKNAQESTAYRTVNYARDNLGRVIEESHPNENHLIIHTTFDAQGNVVQVDKWKKGTGNPVRTSVAMYTPLDQKVIEASAQREATVTFDQYDGQVELEAHGYSVGDRILVLDPTGGVNEGVYYVTGVDSPDSFTYNRTTLTGAGAGTIKVATAVSSYNFDVAGRMLSATDARGFTTDNKYDGAGRLIETQQPAPDAQPMYGNQGTLRPTSTMQYYADGTLARRYDPSFWDINGSNNNRSVTTTSYLYANNLAANPQNKIVTTSKISGTDSVTTTKFLDLAGRTVGIQDGRNNLTQYILDRRGRQLRTTQPQDATGASPVSIMEYDGAGHTIFSATPARGYTSSNYDQAGRVLDHQVTEPLSTEVSATAWGVDRRNGNVYVKLVIPKTYSYNVDDFVSVGGAAWMEIRSQNDPSGEPDPATTTVEYPKAGEYAGSTRQIKIIDNVTETDKTVLYVQVEEKGAPNLDVFLPDFTSATAPRVYKVNVLTGSRNVYAGPVLDTSYDSRGYGTTFRYDNSNRVTETYRAQLPDRPADLGQELSQQTQYNEFGETEQQTSYAANGGSGKRITQFEYDYLGRTVRTTRITDPSEMEEGLSTTNGYDAKGQLRWTMSPKGNESQDPYGLRNLRIYTTIFDYDGLGRKITEGHPNPNTSTAQPYYPTNVNITTFKYDGAGNLTQTTDPLQHSTAKEYDHLNRETARASGGRSASISGNGTVATITLIHHHLATGDRIYLTGYGPTNGTAIATVVNENTISFPFIGAFGSRAITVYAGEVTTSYDHNGNVTATTDARNNTTDYVYDNLNRKTSQTLPAPDTNTARPKTSYTYTLAGDIKTVTDARGNADPAHADEHTTIYEYDNLGRKIKEQSADTDPATAGAQRAETTFKYDTAGHLIATTDPRQIRSETSYDWAGRQVESTLAASVINQVTWDGTYATAQLGALDESGAFV
ncbi:MAG TPA: DUF6531 domain-containing protein, partial [Tepidisphaeraceae bacterium]